MDEEYMSFMAELKGGDNPQNQAPPSAGNGAESKTSPALSGGHQSAGGGQIQTSAQQWPVSNGKTHEAKSPATSEPGATPAVNPPPVPAGIIVPPGHPGHGYQAYPPRVRLWWLGKSK